MHSRGRSLQIFTLHITTLVTLPLLHINNGNDLIQGHPRPRKGDPRFRNASPGPPEPLLIDFHRCCHDLINFHGWLGGEVLTVTSLGNSDVDRDVEGRGGMDGCLGVDVMMIWDEL